MPAGELCQVTVDSPIGPLVLVADDWGLRQVLFPVDDQPAPVPGGPLTVDPDHGVLAAATGQPFTLV